MKLKSANRKIRIKSAEYMHKNKMCKRMKCTKGQSNKYMRVKMFCVYCTDVQ